MQGHIFYAIDDYIQEKGNARSCDALMGHSIKRGEVIGFAGSVGLHPLEENISLLVLTLWPPFGSKYHIHQKTRPLKRETAIFIGFNQGHSFIGNVIALARISPAGYSLILSNVAAIRFLQNNMM